MPFAADIRHWATPADLAAHLARHDPAIASWAKGIVIHHTYTPTVAQWRGVQSVRGARDYYISSVPNGNGTKGGWTAGPHLFICGDAQRLEDRGILQLTPLNIPGIHAGKCNSDHWGIEVVGRYDRAQWTPATADLIYGTVLALMDWRDLTDPDQVVGHRECMPNQKTCPGSAINMDLIRTEVARRLHQAAVNDLAFVSEQRISQQQFARVLKHAESPAAPEALLLAGIPAVYGIDRGVALAFFEHESSFGKKGVCHDFDTKNWGNVRRAVQPARTTGSTPHPFAIFASWSGGLIDWCERILARYVADGLTTVRKALPVYAPSSDGNKPQRYADAVVAAVVRWQTEEAQEL